MSKLVNLGTVSNETKTSQFGTQIDGANKVCPVGTPAQGQLRPYLKGAPVINACAK